MGVFYVIHVVDPHSAAVVLLEVVVAALLYKTVTGLVAKLFSNGSKAKGDN